MEAGNYYEGGGGGCVLVPLNIALSSFDFIFSAVCICIVKYFVFTTAVGADIWVVRSQLKAPSSDALVVGTVGKRIQLPF